MNLDLKLNSDGDLVLGDQSRNAADQLLYYIPTNNNGDAVQLTTDPTIGTIPVRDMDIVVGEESQLQLIKSRLMTENPDWLLYPNIGADLTDLIGKRNTPTTAQEGKDLIIRALTYDKAFAESDITIEAVPVSRETILFDLRIKRKIRVLRYALTVSLKLGVTNVHEIIV